MGAIGRILELFLETNTIKILANLLQHPVAFICSRSIFIINVSNFSSKSLDLSKIDGATQVPTSLANHG